jgi:hypothetical protein
LKWLFENRIGPQFRGHLEIQRVCAAPGHCDDLQFAVVLAYPPDGFYAVGTGIRMSVRSRSTRLSFSIC